MRAQWNTEAKAFLCHFTDLPLTERAGNRTSATWEHLTPGDVPSGKLTRNGVVPPARWMVLAPADEKHRVTPSHRTVTPRPERPLAQTARSSESDQRAQRPELNRKSLEGPVPEEEPELRADGWDPRAAAEIWERRANQEVEQVASFNADPSWRRGRIRDVVAAREVLIEIKEMLYRGLADRGANLDDVFADVSIIRRAFDSLPSFDVAVTLKTSYHHDPSHRWTTNDIHDIDAMGSTLPYCDVVVTDKAISSHIDRTGLSDRLRTVALTQLSELDQHL